jgi:hypothetical protein
MRVSISAIGSDIVISANLLPEVGLLPACFLHAGNLTIVSQFTETNSANFEFAQHGMRTTAALTTSIGLNLELRLALLFHDHRSFCH